LRAPLNLRGAFSGCFHGRGGISESLSLVGRGQRVSVTVERLRLFVEDFQSLALCFPVRRRETFLLRVFCCSLPRDCDLFGFAFPLDTFGIDLFGVLTGVDLSLAPQARRGVEPVGEPPVGDALGLGGCGASLDGSHAFVGRCLTSSGVVSQLVVAQHAPNRGTYGRVGAVNEQDNRGTTLPSIREQVRRRIKREPGDPQTAVDC
jgi:hypothetical protein